MIVSHLLLILHKKIQFYIFMFEAWNVAKGCKVHWGRILSQGTVYFDLFNTFLVATWFPMCYFIVVMSSLLFYNIENSKNKEKPLKELVCPNFWLVLYVNVWYARSNFWLVLYVNMWYAGSNFWLVLYVNVWYAGSNWTAVGEGSFFRSYRNC